MSATNAQSNRVAGNVDGEFKITDNGAPFVDMKSRAGGVDIYCDGDSPSVNIGANDAIVVDDSQHGNGTITIDSKNAKITILLAGTTITIQEVAGGLVISNSASTGSLTMASDGKLTMVGTAGLNLNINSASGSLKILATQVVGPRITGWAAATNTKSKATFDTTTVTLPNLAARVGQIIDDLITHGLIGP